jgi:CheY-like chemotaxis protein
LTDIKMPVMDGLDFLARASDRRRRGVIVITGGRREDRHQKVRGVRFHRQARERRGPHRGRAGARRRRLLMERREYHTLLGRRGRATRT